MGNTIEKIVLAYSGGLDTSVIIKWLKEKYGCVLMRINDLFFFISLSKPPGQKPKHQPSLSWHALPSNP